MRFAWSGRSRSLVPLGAPISRLALVSLMSGPRASLVAALPASILESLPARLVAVLPDKKKRVEIHVTS